MDKKQLKERIILATKIYLLFLVIIFPVNILVSILGGIAQGDVWGLLKHNTYTYILAIIYLGIFIYTIIGLIALFAKIRRKEETIQTDVYTRELPKYFPPAIASLLLDLSIENTTDYTATIAYLISKKYIKLKDNGREVEIVSDTQIFKSKHERYVFEAVTGQRKFDHIEFKKLVVEDAKEMKLVEEGKRKVHFVRNFLIALITYFVFGILYNVVTNVIIQNICGIVGLLAGWSIFGVIGYSIYLSNKYLNESIRRTKKGEVEALKWTGLKNYLKDFTLISEKSLKDITLFDEYIPYAIALNEAKAIEKYIVNNDEYRQLIYGKDA